MPQCLSCGIWDSYGCDRSDTNTVAEISDFWLKIWLYAVSTSLTITGLGMASKTTSTEVMQHTTKVIIYATVGISLAELFFALA